MTETVGIYSEADLAREFEQAAVCLADVSKIYTENDWQDRVKSLKRMQAIIASGGTAFDNFLPLMVKFMTPLSFQLGDLRSAIVKEAENTLIRTAEACRDSFEPCSDRIADTLFKLLSSGTKVLAESGHLSIMGVLENVVSWRLVPKIVDNIRSRNAFVRGRSAGYLAYVLEHYPKEVFESGEAGRGRVLELIEQGIVCAVQDASPEARSAGRAGYLSYRTMFLDRSESIYNRLDSAAKKTIADLIGSPPIRYARTMPAQGGKQKASRESPQLGRPHQGPEKRLSSSSRQSPSLPLTLSPPSHPTNSFPELPSDKPIQKCPSSSQLPPRKSHLSPKPKLLPTSPTANGRKPVVNSDIGSSGPATKDPPKSSPPPPPDEAITVKSKAKEVAPGDELEFVIEKTYNENWSTRCNSFIRLVSMMGERKDLDGAVGRVEGRNPMWEKLVDTHIEHLSDPQFKVVSSCLSSLQKLIDLLPEKMSYELERLLPPLLLCLGDAKEGVYQAACVTLEQIMDLYMADDLLKLTVKPTTSEINAKQCAKTLEILSILCEASDLFFTVSTNATAYLRKLAYLCKDMLSTKSVLQAGSRCLQLLMEKSIEKSVKQLAGLSPEEQTVIRRLTSEVPRVIGGEQRKEEPGKTVGKLQDRPQGGDMPGALAMCHSAGEDREKGLVKLRKLVEDEAGNDDMWAIYGLQVVDTLIEALSDESPSIRESALSLLVVFYPPHRSLLYSSVPLISRCLIKSLSSSDDHRQSLSLYESALQSILDCEPIDIALEGLTGFLQSEDSPALQTVVRIATRMVRKKDTLNGVAEAVETLGKTLNHTNPDVRKTVVFCLVELSCQFGDEFQPYMAQLSQSQQKLVSIYVQRRQAPYI